MAILVAVAGAAIGSATGIGGSLGWTIGSVLGQLLFPAKGKNTTTEGPRLGDLAVSSSAYGVAIGIGYGTFRCSGNIIWGPPIKETRHKKTQKTGGKGGGGAKATSITYTYSASFALGLVEGVADDILRIWADGKLIFDKRPGSENVRKQGLKFNFYRGTEDQLQDPVIVADKGADRTPAHRGLCYIVFDSLELADFGNRIPNITCEITMDAEANRMFIPADPWTTGEGGGASSFSSNGIAVDWTRQVAWVKSSSPTGFRRINLQTMKEDRQIFEEDMFDNPDMALSSIYGFNVGPDGAIVCVTDDTSAIGSNNLPISRFDPNTFKETARFGRNGLLAPQSSPRTWGVATKFAWAQAYTQTGITSFLFAGLSLGQVGILKYPSMEYLWDTKTFGLTYGSDFDDGLTDNVLSILGLPLTDGFARAIVMCFDNATDLIKFYKLTVASTADYEFVDMGLPSEGPNGEDQEGLVNDIAFGVEFTQVGSIALGDIHPGATNISQGGHLVYDETDGTYIFAVEESGGEDYWVKTDLNNILWTANTAAFGPNNGDHLPSNYYSQSRIRGGVLGYVINERPYLIDTATGELLENGTAPDYLDGSNAIAYGVFDSDQEVYVGLNSGTIAGKWFFRRADGNSANVADIVEDICGRVDLLPVDLDVSDLADDTVPGYIIGSRSSARQAIEPLAQAFFFDGVESDFTLKFVERGQDPIRTITQGELGSMDRSGEPLKETRQQEVELPERVTVLYMDKAADYQQGTQSDKRLRNPNPSMFSHNQITATFPAVFETDFAKQLAQKILYSAWVERASYEAVFSWEHMDLDPTDPVSIELDDGTVFRTRLLQVEMGEGFTIPISGVSERAAQYISTVAASGGDGPNQNPINSATYTKLILLDIPLLRDSDEPAGRTVIPTYNFMGSFTSGWYSGIVMKSPENTTFSQVSQNVSPMTWGTLTNVLEDPPYDNPFATDLINSINVAFIQRNDDIASCTELEMLNGANAAAIIKANGEVEIIQWMTAVEEVNGTYTLSHLLRGVRGTDTMAYDHELGETFLLLDDTDGDVFPLALTEFNTLRYYRGVGTGNFLEDAETVQMTSQGRALKPYAPVHVEAAPGASSSVDISWVRRTRVGGEMLDGIPEVPLNEDDEEYELEILDVPGGTVVRTVTGLTSPAWNYSSANQTSDGFTPPVASVTVRVYQISAQVGRGFTKEYTVNVE